MYKKRIRNIITVVLSLFVLLSSCQVFAKTDYTLTDAASMRRLSIYMQHEKSEPTGGIDGSRIYVSGGTKEDALKLYDGNTGTRPENSQEMTVTLDMGINILFSQIRYYTGKIEENKNNSFGTRFYASRDNVNFNELTVSEGTVPVENKWNTAEFSGFGEYRYFKVVVPAESNLCEIEWMGTSGYKKEYENGSTYINLSLWGYNEGRELPTTILACVFNKNGIMKSGQVFSQVFNGKSETGFEIRIKNAAEEAGDSYRIAVFDKEGAAPIPSPLTYRINNASKGFSVASVFGSNMMLQADKPFILWGNAPEGAIVEAKLKNTAGGEVLKKVKVMKDSEWQINMGTFSKGGNYTLTVKADSKSVEYKNITFGDVWLLTGQSNMAYYMATGEETAKDLRDSSYIRNKNIRIYNLWEKGIDGAAMPVDNPPVKGVYWREATSDTVAYCSAVGYYFARKLNEETNMPIGIINVAVSDTEINRWTEKGLTNGRFMGTDGDLYNNRIYPFSKLNIKGIIMYQGEADQYRTHMTALEYRDALTGLINSYRKTWGADLPFYWAQLTRYKIDESEVKEGQRLALQTVSVKKNTGMVVLNDIFGNYNGGEGSCREDIHPWGKKIAGERFAAYALRDCYDIDGDVVGPMYKSSVQNGNKLELTFDCTGSLRIMPKEEYSDKITMDKIKKGSLKPDRIAEFEVAGDDKNFYPATAQISGNKLILTSGQVASPKYARYSWGEYPEMPNLTDDSGLPAAVFYN